jgi:hypothetical protein
MKILRQIGKALLHLQEYNSSADFKEFIPLTFDKVFLMNQVNVNEVDFISQIDIRVADLGFMQ